MNKTIKDYDNYNELSRDVINKFINYDAQPAKEKTKLGALHKKYKERLFTGFLFRITSIYFEPYEAEKIWADILKHKGQLKEKLNRNIDIGVAALDYFLEFKNEVLSNPLIIEEKIFEKIRNRILIDDLTGLYNYRYYKQRIIEETAKAKRYNSIFSLIMLDIDDFKLYNDTHGHLEGNKVLKKIADVLVDILRSADVIIRFGGEEFIVILPQIEKRGAIIVGEKIRTGVCQLKLKSPVTISGGVATYLLDTDGDENDLLHLADMALYRAKYEGKNRICNYPVDRRTIQRIPLSENVDVSIKLISLKIPAGKKQGIRDISTGGICLYINKLLKTGNIIKGRIRKNKKELSFTGEVRWASRIEANIFETGIKFIKVSRADLKNFLDVIC